MIEEKPKPKVILYARVSTKKQENYLKNQIARLEEAEGLIAIVTSFAAKIYGSRGGKKKNAEG